MRVIADRSMEGDFPIRFDCRRCKSTVEADQAEDVMMGYFGPNYGGESPQKEMYVSCPVCGCNRVLPYEERRRVPAARRKELGFR